MRLLKTLLLWLCIPLIALSQGRTVSGVVTDQATGAPLNGVTVTEKNTNNAVSTNEAGQFTIQVAGKGAVLQISYVGYAQQELAVGNSNSLSVALKVEERALQEVYVVAYGNQSKRTLTSAVSTVGAEQIGRQQVTTVTQALQGTAAGVLVVNNSGQPGDAPQIRIRGIASVNASAQPLIVVDGVPFDGNINMINPNDIDNFSILKDASATALYGSRAANGVVLITTKGGRKNQKPKVTLNAATGFSSRALPEYEFANLQQLMELNWEGLRNLYQDAGVANPAQQASTDLIREHLLYNPYGNPEPVGTNGQLLPGLSPKWNTDWTKELTRKQAVRQDVNLGMAGGSNNNTYYFGLGYLGQEGNLITSQFKRVSTRFNFTSDVNRWLTMGVRTQYVYSDQNYPNQIGSSFDNVVQYIRQMSSLYPVYKRNDAGDLILDADGQPQFDFGDPVPGRTFNHNRQTLQPSNLLATTLTNTERRQRHMTTLNGFAEAKILPSLKLRTNFGVDRYQFNSMSYQTPLYGVGAGVGGRLGRQIDGTTSWTWNNMLTYKQKINQHQIELMGSAEMYRYQYEIISGQKNRFPFTGLTEFNSAANTEQLNGYKDDHAIMSYLGRARYDFAGKYFIEATARWDGSSRFAKDYRWGFFPTVGAGWLVSDEGFMQPIKQVSLLKLRGSYGRVGNENLLSFFPYVSSFSSGEPALDFTYDELGQAGLFLNQLGNEKIKWETQANWNIGLDFGLWRNRLSGSVDYFNKSSIDLLFSRPLVLSGGIPFIDDNIGDVQNRGIELSLNGTILQKKNLTWEMGANATWVKNTLKKLPQEKLLNSPYQQQVGKSIFEFFMPEWAGVDPTDGKGMWYADELDGSGNPTGKRITTKSYSQATRYYQGSAIPKVSGGWNTRLQFMQFDLSLLVNFALGGKYYDGNYGSLVSAISSSPGNQLHADLLSRWQKPGDITNIPRLDINNTDYGQTSTRFLFNGDYARLRNITLGYNYKATGKAAQAIEGFRVFVQADNLFTLSGLKTGADPEANVDGRARNTTSVFKTISAGVEVRF